MRAVWVGWGLLATLPACEPPRDRPPVPPARDAAAAPAAQSRFYPTHMLDDLTEAAGDSARRQRERAQGIVVSKFTTNAPDELVVLNDTSHEVQTVARVRFYKSADGGWTDTIWTRESGLYGEIMRATHEDYGLPVMSVHGPWLRVHYAYAVDGAPRAGWVKLVPGTTIFHDWDQQLFEFSTSLARPETTALYAAPNGGQLQIDLTERHTLQVLRADPQWIRVVIMRPDTSACTGDEKLKVRQRDTVWVRRFNAQGQRQLQSAFAGC
jgi:hypothetical protein